MFEIDEDRTRYACKIEEERDRRLIGSRLGLRGDSSFFYDLPLFNWTPCVFVRK